jgi:hypothetical protein
MVTDVGSGVPPSPNGEDREPPQTEATPSEGSPDPERPERGKYWWARFNEVCRALLDGDTIWWW